MRMSVRFRKCRCDSFCTITVLSEPVTGWLACLQHSRAGFGLVSQTGVQNPQSGFSSSNPRPPWSAAVLTLRSSFHRRQYGVFAQGERNDWHGLCTPFHEKATVAVWASSLTNNWGFDDFHKPGFTRIILFRLNMEFLLRSRCHVNMQCHWLAQQIHVSSKVLVSRHWHSWPQSHGP